jgi:hypothetical protein
VKEQNKVNEEAEVDVEKPIVASLSDYSDFEQVYIDPKSGGKILRHKNVDHNLDDYKEVWEISVDKAKEGCEVHILPVLHPKDKLYPIVFKGAIKGKCPDIKVNGTYHEIATPLDVLNENKISNCIRHSQQQADHLIIRLLSPYSAQWLQRIAKGRFKTHKRLKSIEFKLEGKYYRFYRGQYYAD